ncbi:MAG: hypothetical protein QF612_00880 [Candidatus Thalassarchaeaceae archaeon]|jgi:hypothetical protein|nr:hypothetical protein [Candidatus Thalassarchaeaceae archaeon]
MPTFSEDKRWVWDYSAERWIPANQVEKIAELKDRGVTEIVIEPGLAMTEDLGTTHQGEWNGTNLKLFAMAMAFFLPGLDYSVLGCIKPRKNKQIGLGIGILCLCTFFMGTAIFAPLALIIWIHGLVTVAGRARDRVEELGGYTNDIRGRRIQRKVGI